MLKMLFTTLTAVLLSGSLTLYADPSTEIINRFGEIPEITRNMGRMNRDVGLTEIIGQMNDMFDPGADIWINDHRLRFSYDEFGRIGFFDEFVWDQQEEAWISGVLRGHVNWSVSGDLEGVILSYYDEDYNEWIEIMRAMQSYNIFDQITELSLEMKEMDEWVTVTVYDFHYDDNNRLEYFLSTYYGDNDGWPNRIFEADMTHFNYDGEGRISEILVTVTEDGDVWYNMENSFIEYHPADNSQYQDFQDFLNQFVLMMIGASGYGSSLPFMFESEDIYHWDEGLNEWDLAHKNLYFYDSNNLVTSIEFHVWSGDEWELSDRELYSYDDDDLLSQILYQWYHFDFWIDEYRELFFFNETSSVEQGSVSSTLLEVTNFPNPFNPETKISFSIDSEQNVELKVYNILGQKIRTLVDEPKRSGYHRIVWDGTDDRGVQVPSGVYFYRLTGNETVVRKKMLLLK